MKINFKNAFDIPELIVNSKLSRNVLGKKIGRVKFFLSSNTKYDVAIKSIRLAKPEEDIKEELQKIHKWHRKRNAVADIVHEGKTYRIIFNIESFAKHFKTDDEDYRILKQSLKLNHTNATEVIKKQLFKVIEKNAHKGEDFLAQSIWNEILNEKLKKYNEELYFDSLENQSTVFKDESDQPSPLLQRNIVENNDGKAKYELGIKCKKEGGIPNLNKAYINFAGAAIRGHVDAMIELGIMCETEENFIDEISAERWYLKAVEQNNPRAMYLLSNLYNKIAEKIIDNDPIRAEALIQESQVLFERAAKMGYLFE